MKKTSTLFTYLLFIICSTLQADNFQFSVGPHVNYTRIKFDQPEDVDGCRAGITAEVNHCHPCIQSSLLFEGTWDTNFLTGEPAQRTSVDEYLVSLRFGFQSLLSCGCDGFEPYVGVGWDRLNYDVYPETIDLQYEYDKIFIPVGFVLRYCENSYFRGLLQIEWRPDVYACLHLADVKFDNKKEHAFRIQAPLNFVICNRCFDFDLSIIPFFDWTRYGKAVEENNANAVLTIPSLSKWDAGARLMFGVHF